MMPKLKKPGKSLKWTVIKKPMSFLDDNSVIEDALLTDLAEGLDRWSAMPAVDASLDILRRDFRAAKI